MVAEEPHPKIYNKDIQIIYANYLFELVLYASYIVYILSRNLIKQFTENIKGDRKKMI